MAKLVFQKLLLVQIVDVYVSDCVSYPVAAGVGEVSVSHPVTEYVVVGTGISDQIAWIAQLYRLALNLTTGVGVTLLSNIRVTFSTEQGDPSPAQNKRVDTARAWL